MVSAHDWILSQASQNTGQVHCQSDDFVVLDYAGSSSSVYVPLDLAVKERQAIAAVIVFYCLLLAALLAPLLFLGKAPFLADATYNTEPASRFVREYWLENLKLPLWNPWILNGVPSVAATWPTSYLPAIVGLFFPFGVAAGIFMFAHLLLAGTGGFFWQLRSSKFQPPNMMASAFFGLGYMLCGYMAGCWINLSLMATAAWIPFILLVLDKIACTPRWWHCGALALLFGMQFSAGRPEVSLGCVVLCFALWLTAERRSPNSFLLLVTSLLMGCGLSAPNYLPLIELIQNSPSAAQFSVVKSNFWSAGLLDWMTLIFSEPFGPINMSSGVNRVTYPGTIPYITSLFLGTPVLTFVIFGLIKNWKTSLFWLTLVLLATLISVGQFGPVSQLFVMQNVIRYPIKFAIFTLFGLLVIASIGWRSAFSQELPKPLVLGVAAFWLLFSIGLLVIDKSTALTAVEKHAMYGSLTTASLTGFLTGAFIYIKHKRTGLAVLVLVAGSLFWNATNQMRELAPAVYYNERSLVADVVARQCPLAVSNYRVLPLVDNSLVPPKTVAVEARGGADLDLDFSRYCRDILRPNTNIDSHLQTSNGMSLVPTWASLFIDVGLLPRSALNANAHPLGKSDLPLFRYCQATSTAFVETPMEQMNDDGTWVQTPLLDARLFRQIKVDAKLNVRLYSITHIRPRVSVIENVRLVKTREEALKYINRSDTNGFDPVREVTILGAPPLPKRAFGELSPYATVDVNQNDYVRISANASVPAALVLTDSYYPGWEAFDNGLPTQIYIADGFMRAVILDPGEHRVVFRYRPTSWQIGIVLFFVSLSAAGFMLMTKTISGRQSEKEAV